MSTIINLPAQAKIFAEAFEVCKRELEFNPAWKNGTGYMDGVVNAVIPGLINIGDFGKFVDDFGRKGLIVKTRLGNVVVFQRYKDSNVFVNNAPSWSLFESLIGHSSMGENHMLNFVGMYSDMENNIAYVIESAYQAMKRRDKETIEA